MTIQRPGRGSTRLGQPAVKAPAKATPAPAGRPATGGVQKQAPSTGRGGRSSTTRSVPTAGGRPSTRSAAPKSNTTLFIGIGVGLAVLLAVAFVAMNGKSETTAPLPAKESSKPKPVDVAGLERDGMNKCDKGLAIIKKCESQMASSTLSDAEKARLKTDLESATGFLRDGMAMLDEANRKSGNTYSISPYIEAKKVARMKLGELGGK
jgi:hypothetical protein